MSGVGSALPCLALTLLICVPRVARSDVAPGRPHPNSAVPARPEAQEPQPEPIVVEIQIGQLAMRTVGAYRVGSAVLLPLGQFFEMAEIRHTLSAEGRFDAVFDPGHIPMRVDATGGVATSGARQLPIAPDLKLFAEGELYLGTRHLGELLNVEFVVNESELTVTVMEPRDLPIARRIRREKARQTLVRRSREGMPELSLGLERPRWKGLVLDYSVLAPSRDVLAGASYTAALGTDVLGGSLQLGAASQGRVDRGELRAEASWTGVWRERPWLKQLRLGDGSSTGPHFRPQRGLSLTNAPFIRLSDAGTIHYDGHVEPGWTVEAYRLGDLVAYDSADVSGRYGFDLPVQYGENPVDFIAYGPFGEVREFNSTYRVITEVLPNGKFEYGASGGACSSARCTATANLDVRYGAGRRLTVQAGLEQFWRDALPDLFHPYGAVVANPTNAWALGVESVNRAFTVGRLRYEPSVNLRFQGEYTRFSRDVADPVLTPKGRLAQWSLRGFWRPRPNQGLFFVDGSLDQTSTDLTANTRARLGASLQSTALRIQPYVRLERYGSSGVPTADRKFMGLDGFVLPRPHWGRILGRLSMRTSAEFEAESGAVPLVAATAFAIGQVVPTVQLEVGTSWVRGSPGPTFRLGITSNLSAVRAHTGVTAGGGGPMVGTQFLQGSILWDQASNGLAAAPGPSLQRSGVSGSVFLDENANGVRDAGEQGMAGVRVQVGYNSALTDSNGAFRVWDIIPFEPVMVAVDSLSLPSPLFVPAFASASIEPGPNRFRVLDIPIVQAGVLDGRVVRQGPGGLEGIGGVTLVLEDRRTGGRRSVVTFGDGGFYMLGARPGDYELRVDDQVLRALNVTAEPLRFLLTPSEEGTGKSGIEIVLRPRQ